MARQTKRTNRAREAFLSALRDSANVSEAARAAGLGRQTVYEWRADDQDFAAAWDEAAEAALDDLEKVAWDRARGWRDEATGRYLYSDRMLELLLKANRKGKYAERSEVTGEGGGALNVTVKRLTDGD